MARDTVFCPSSCHTHSVTVQPRTLAGGKEGGRGCSIVWPGRCPYKTGGVGLQRAPYQGAHSFVVAVFLFVLVHFPIVSGELQAQKIPPPHNRATPLECLLKLAEVLGAGPQDGSQLCTNSCLREPWVGSRESTCLVRYNLPEDEFIDSKQQGALQNTTEQRKRVILAQWEHILLSKAICNIQEKPVASPQGVLSG